MDFELPELGEGVYEAELVRWLVATGDAVKRGQGLMEVLTDKATMEVPAPFAGVVTGTRAEAGGQVKVGQVVLTYDPSGKPAGAVEPAAAPPAPKQANGTAASAAVAAPPARSAPPAGVASPLGRPVAAPSVRHLARKMGIDLREVEGTGPAGRILLDDLAPLLRAGDGDAPKPDRRAGIADLLDVGRAGSRVPMQGIRRTIAEHMVASKRDIPHYAYVDEVDVTDLVKLRASLKGEAEKRGAKLTYLAFFVKAASLTLKDVPIVNSSLDEGRNEIVTHEGYHVGVAVTTKNGLMVPVVKDADKKDVITIAAEIDRLSRAARDGRARRDELRGGTFTITSVGNIGGLISTPIINQPEVAILGLGKVVKRPVFDDRGAVVPADMIYLSFSFDHRVVDGAVGAHFGNLLADRLRSPAALLL